MTTSHHHAPSRRNHLLGVLIVIAVACIWTFTAELIQFIFQGDKPFDKPYFVTYFSVSLFSILLFGFLRTSWRASAAADQPVEQPMQSMSNPAIIEGEYDLDFEQPAKPQLSVRAVFHVGAQLAPLFFLSSWTYNIALDMTSVASSSIISSLTTLFTLVLGTMLGSVRFTMGKLIATGLSIAGVILISQQDTNGQKGERSFQGDLVNIGSSFVYALYTVLLNKNTDGAAFSMSMMLGFMGFVTLLGFWPGMILCSVFGWESFEIPQGKVLALLLLNGLVGTVLSDFLWAKSVELAGSMIGTLSLSLSVPLSIIADYFLRGKTFALVYLLGTILVVSGFLLMNFDIARERQEENQELGNDIASELETLG
ncbi:unnamed protein product [Agarophyton chilense]